MKILFAAFIFFNFAAFAIQPAAPAVDQAWQSVVQIKIPGYDGQGDLVDGLCVGTLLDANTLVTAAHCVTNSTLNSNGQIKIEIGEYQFRQRPDGTSYRLGYITTIKHETTVSVQFSGSVQFDSPANRIPPENDYAIVHLKTAMNLPSNFFFAQMWNRPIQNVRLMNPSVVSVNVLEYISSSDTKQIAILNKVNFQKYSAQSTSLSRIAPGDSGAPLFATIEGQTYIIGVTKGLATAFFSNYDVFAIFGGR